MDQRAQEDIERARQLLALSAERLNRGEARIKREQARRSRQQAQIDRESAGTERDLAAWRPDPKQLIGQRKALRTETGRAIEALTMNEERVARTYEDLAVSQPERRQEYRATAEQARDTARKVREVLRAFHRLTSLPD